MDIELRELLIKLIKINEDVSKKIDELNTNIKLNNLELKNNLNYSNLINLHRLHNRNMGDLAARF